MHVKIFGPWTPCACCGTDYYQPCWVLKGGWVNSLQPCCHQCVPRRQESIVASCIPQQRQLYVFKNTWAASDFDSAFIENTHLREFTQNVSNPESSRIDSAEIPYDL